ncbi:MAG: aldo/keto reductase [Lewinella sp.]|nr:aldo/keto reductase [Lewinella sp.]
MTDIKRRHLIKAGLFAATTAPFARLLPAQTIVPSMKLIRRQIPGTEEFLPVIGMGTWQTFDVGSNAAERANLKQVLQTFIDKGGSLIDSSPMYGTSEEVAGDLAAELGELPALFMATKVWTQGKEAGIRQMEQSMREMRRDPMDLMQIHNLLDLQTHLKTLRRWKDEGKIRYLGITHYTDSAHDELERLIKKEELDFIQINYSINDRNADQRLLPTAQDHGVAVLINRPFSGGSLFQQIKGKELPAWAADHDIQSWGQYFLKYIVSHPAVTCAIPATSKVHHMEDNMQAGYGRLPDEKVRQEMVKYLMN